MAEFLKIRIFLVFLVACSLATAAATPVDSLMRQLDDVIAHREVFLREKEQRLEQLRSRLLTEDSDRGRFDVLNRLYDEYHPFNTDSAYSISLRQQAIAMRLGDADMLLNARMNLANILCATGMYRECMNLMDSVAPASLPDYLRPYYYHIMRTVYGRMSDYAAFPAEKERYARITDAYRDSIVYANQPGTLAHVITKADCLNVNGAPDSAIVLLQTFMSSNNLSEHERAICAWTLSEAYALTGNRELQKENVLLSAISDLKSSVREYVSLRQLALMLYAEGDLDRAYRFMAIAVDDAAKCNARQRIIELNDTYPMINAIYVDTVRRQKHTLEIYIIIIAVLAVLLIILLICMRKQMLRIKQSNSQLQEAYERQNRLTEELTESNKKLTDANYAIAENSELKEVYIGRYMDQCLGYIEKLDAYRKSLHRLANSGKSEELKKHLKSTAEVDDELKAFYYRFDKTFLSLFPTFVEDFNSLLLPEEAIIPKKEGTLNTELRIYALIRLGISDSERIARFLRYSITTIYNYRTKVRNKARGDRNTLEAEILDIGRPQR